MKVNYQDLNEKKKLKKKKKTSSNSKLDDNIHPSSTRRKTRDNLIIEVKQHKAFLVKQKHEEGQIALAMKALARVEEVQKRQTELRKEYQEMIKKKALLRLQKIQKREGNVEKILNNKKEEVKIELLRQEKIFEKIREKERKKYEQEMKWRQEKIYGQKKETNHFTELRKKLLDSKTISPIQNKENIQLPLLSPKPVITIDEIIKKGPKLPRPISNKPIIISEPVKKSKIPFLKPKNI